MFGDDDGTVLSFAFRLRDSEARGFARWYSLILLSTDAYHVAACHASLTHYLRTVVRQLKQRALALFNRDMAAQTASASNPSDKNNNSSSNSSGNSSVVSMTPGLFRKEAGSTKLRSLVELTQCPPLFSELHTQFAWILKAYRQRFVLKPPPLIDLRIFPQTEAVCAAVAATAAAESAEAAASSSSAATASNVLRVSSLFHALGDADEIILFCVLSGRRVFVRGQQPDDAPLAADVCRVLVQLLPANVAWHIKTLTSADVSLDSVPATTRFVVLPPDYEIPADVAPASFALIDVLQCAPLRVACSGPTRSSWLGAALRDALVRRRQLNETALLCLIEYVKSSWLSKCELYSAFVAAQPKAAAAHGRADAIDAERVDRFLQVVGLTGKDLALLHYWCSFLKPQQ
jgi:folliculin